MIRPGQAVRLFYISWTLIKHGLDDLIFATHLFRPLHFLRYFMPWRLLRNAEIGRGERIRKTLEFFHADRLNYAVVGTPNRLEYDQGFFVKNGDG